MFCENCGHKITDDAKFCDKCGYKISDDFAVPNNFSTQNIGAESHNRKALYIVLTVVVVLIIIWIFSSSSNNSSSPSNIQQTNNQDVKPVQQQDITKNESRDKATSYGKISEAVVNILCPYANEPFSVDSSGTGGSGTVIGNSGLIISNAHIVPKKNKALNTSSKGCFVVFPDNATGAPKEIYVARPIVLDNLSEKYDLAFFSVYDAYIDENGYKFGQYPNNNLPSFSPDDSCVDNKLKLGDSIRILGYPVSSGGYNLTITDGIISSFSDDGLILTSAKIDQGNSGGLAVTENGCMVGIPSAVSEGEYDKLGVIIPTDIVINFIKEAIDK